MTSKVASNIAHIQVGTGGRVDRKNIIDVSTTNTEKNIISKSRTGDLDVIGNIAILHEYSGFLFRVFWV
jgi:hypothetical protein